MDVSSLLWRGLVCSSRASCCSALTFRTLRLLSGMGAFRKVEVIWVSIIRNCRNKLWKSVYSSKNAAISLNTFLKGKIGGEILLKQTMALCSFLLYIHDGEGMLILQIVATKYRKVKLFFCCWWFLFPWGFFYFVLLVSSNTRVLWFSRETMIWAIRN